MGTKVKVDPKLKSAWRKLIARVRGYEKRGSEAWDAEWEAVGAILEHSPPLYELGGHKNAAEFLEKELGVNERVGRAYVRVAEHATPDDERKYTVFRLDAALGYLAATEGPLPRKKNVDFARVRIGGKKLEGCTVAEIKAATAKALGARSKAAPKAYRAALAKAFAKHAAFRALRIVEANGKVSFHGVPNASLRAFAEVVLEAALPK